MRHFLLTVIGTVIGIFAFFFVSLLILIGFGLIGTISASFQPKDNYVLSLDLRQSMTDHDAGATLFGDSGPSVVSTARALHRAKSDDSIKGLFIRADSAGMAPASAEELRLALLDFKDSGKFIISHAQGFESTSILPYQAVSASDEIWLQDTTGFSVSGLRSETEFYGGVFEKFGANPQFEQFHEYKNAVNTYIKTDFTDEHREATTSYLTSIFDNAAAQIAEDRNLDVPALTRILQSAPHSAENAKEMGMVDKLGHLETAREYARTKAGGKTIKFKSVSDYGVGGNVTGDTIAFIGGQGAVVSGSSGGSSPFSSGTSMGGDTLAKGFDAAIKDKKVKAIIFRVSSPGGSPSASDQILAALDRAREAGKPVIISMGQYAASGGYYVSAH
ncbi:MAG: S49 family peptidase, partial [Litorimonas sp.]